ncbi:DNA-binding SAP [Nannochloropsis gaditana]|uniref:DNA-binding SAP n=1 Tax=Nannochloropsis gaditana TaxID=72520 RepID=W7THF8_9STRA|nr:DNA-binding SAP [Nannochloropsis gaditana]
MDVDTEELRQIYDALSVRELKEELTSRGLQTEGTALEKRDLIDQLLRADNHLPPLPSSSTTSSSLTPGSSAPTASATAPSSATIADFCSLTGAGPEAAVHILEAMGGDLEQAVSYYLDSGGIGFGTSGGKDGGEEGGGERKREEEGEEGEGWGPGGQHP